MHHVDAPSMHRGVTLNSCSRYLRALPLRASALPANFQRRAMATSALSNVPNFRDLSWVHDEMKPGRLMRSAKPTDASVEDVAQLLDVYGIRVLVDLRSREELDEDSPHSLILRSTQLQTYRRRWSGKTAAIPSCGLQQHQDTSHQIVRHNVSLMDRWRYYGGMAQHIPIKVTAQALLLRPLHKEGSRLMLLKEVNAGGLTLMYKVILDSARPEICLAMSVILEALEGGRPVLLFCKAGKDRTGLICALVLAVVGCTEEQIVQDYVRSNEHRMAALAGIENKPELRGLDLSKFKGSPAEAIQEAIAYVSRRHGSLTGYLEGIGFGVEQQRRLRRVLTDPSWVPATQQAKHQA